MRPDWNDPFHNPLSGETLIHGDRLDGTRDLKIVQTGVRDDRGGHAVLGPNGVHRYIRDVDGHVVCDDRLSET